MSNVYAVILNDLVDNLVQWDGKSNWTPPEDCEIALVPDGVFVDLGYLWDGNSFHAPS